MSSSESNTFAGPAKRSPFLAGDLRHGAVGREVAAQDPDVAARQDRLLDRLNDLLPGLRAPARPARFSASVLPVTVMQSPCRNPRSSRYFISAGVPPTSCRSSCTYVPLGFRSASSGTRSLDALEVVERRAARRPPAPSRSGAARRWSIRRRAITSTIAFSNAFARQDVARLEIRLEQQSDRRAGAAALVRLAGILGRASTSCTAATGPSASIADGHRVGRVHAAARAGARTRMADDVEPLLVGDRRRRGTRRRTGTPR